MQGFGVMNMPSWYSHYPKKTNGLDLIGKQLELTDIEPQSTNFGGMKSVVVREKGKTATHSVFMTETDLGNAAECMTMQGFFVFLKPSADEKYAKVSELDYIIQAVDCAIKAKKDMQTYLADSIKTPEH